MNEICKTASEAIALEGGAPSDPTLREHAERCPDCSRLLASVTAVEEELGALEGPDVSDAVVEALLKREELKQKPRAFTSRYGGLALAAAAVVAMVGYSLTRQTMRERHVPERYAMDRATDFDDLEEASKRAAETPPPPPPAAVPEPPERPERSERKDDTEGAELADELSSLGYVAGTEAPRDRVAQDKSRTEREYDAPDAEEPQAGRLGLEVRAEGERRKTEPQNERLVDALTLNRRLDLSSRDLEKRVDVAPVYPEAAKQDRIEGTVLLVLTIDPEGNVVEARVLRSVPGLDEAALEAVRQWKFVPSEEGRMRHHYVSVPFELEEKDDESAALLLGRGDVTNLRFREARGYWSNTYLPGDPAIRLLKHRLEKAGLHAPHEHARPVAQPFDPPERGALALFVSADRRGISEPSRLLVQVGLQATAEHGRRRPPMNLAVVLDVDENRLPAARALLTSLQESKEIGDRFRLVRTGAGEVVAPEDFRHGALTVALAEPAPRGDVAAALRLALERVHAGDDPTMPLGTSAVLLVTDRALDRELDALRRLAHRSAIGGVPVSVVGMDEALSGEALDAVALAGQGRRYTVTDAEEASSVVERELTATSRAVARAVRLRIKLAPGVKLVDVLDAEPLSERQAARVREAERSIDLRLARNLGIEADRGEDEDGIQIVIPTFYASDAHTILLDVVAERPGPLVEVTARYKDLAALENTVARASLALPRSTETPGPLETNVVKNYLATRLAATLERAAEQVERAEREAAVALLRSARERLERIPGLAHHREVAADVAMLRRYEERVSSSQPRLARFWADSLRYASSLKRGLAPVQI